MKHLTRAAELLHGEEETVSGDVGYVVITSGSDQQRSGTNQQDRLQRIRLCLRPHRRRGRTPAGTPLRRPPHPSRRRISGPRAHAAHREQGVLPAADARSTPLRQPFPGLKLITPAVT